jgi:hypothetical protein
VANAPPRKYLSEFAVNLYSARWLMVTPSELMSGGTPPADAAELVQRCHIYLICRRPGTVYDPATFKFDGQAVSGHLIYKIAGKSHSVEFQFPFQLVDGATSVRVSPYPHRDIETLLSNGEVVRRVPAAMVAVGLAHVDVLRQLDVLYVGQAYAEGKRSALDRLKSHSTLQKILADIHHNMPDDEVFLLAFEYLPYRVITTMDGIDKTAIRDETDSKRFMSIIDHPLTEHQQICLVEAGLIRYFTPAYNEIYKDSFPAADQKILSSCYDLDFSGLIVEIDTEELRMQLFSKHVRPSEHHIAKFDLVDPQIRRSFFTLATKEGGHIDFPNVIPPTR